MSRSAFKIATVFVSVILALLIIEIVLRMLDLGYGHIPLDSDPVLHHAHPKNYVYTVHDPRGEYGGHKIYFDQEGYISNPANRYTASVEDGQDNAKHRIAFMGDSFTEAMQLGYEDTFIGILESSAGSDAVLKNYGVSNYSPIIYLLQWREQVREFKPTHVILQLYSNDISEDESSSKNAVYSENEELVAIAGERQGYNKLLRTSYLVRLIRKIQLQISWVLENWNQKKQVVGGLVEENPELTEMSTGFVLKLADEVRQAGAEFVLMVVPSKYRLVSNGYNDPEPEFSDKWKGWAKNNSIEFLDLVPSFIEADKMGQELFYEEDIHLNSNGHNITAGQIKKKYPSVFAN